MTVATSITFSRLLAAALMLPFIYLHSGIGFQIATAIFVCAIASDALDGFVARKLNQTTTLGAKLDPLVDKILIYSSLFGLMQMNAVSPMFVYPMFFRDMMVDGLRNKATQNSAVLGANVWGKAKFSLQSVSILFGLSYCITSNDWLILGANASLIAALVASLPGVLIVVSAFQGGARDRASSKPALLAKMPVTIRFF
jgi:CDP-diacylglycerol--glycerol-3-phosphate 3-phosphatidyltransferase